MRYTEQCLVTMAMGTPKSVHMDTLTICNSVGRERGLRGGLCQMDSLQRATPTGTNGSSLETFNSYVDFIFFKRDKMSSEHLTSAARVFGGTWLDVVSKTYRHLSKYSGFYI